MRGNPLRVLDELTLSGGRDEAQAGQVATTTPPDADNEISIGDETGAPSGHSQLSAEFKANISRLFETYPQLVKALIGPHLSGQAEMDELWHFLSEQFEDLRVPYDTSNNNLQLDDDQQQPLASSQSSSTTVSPLGGDDDLAESSASSTSASAGQSGSVYGDELDSEPDLAKPKGDALSLARLKQLQELDLGECQISYIKWDTFRHLDSLKRLQLDGNRLR